MFHLPILNLLLNVLFKKKRIFYKTWIYFLYFGLKSMYFFCGHLNNTFDIYDILLIN